MLRLLQCRTTLFVQLGHLSPRVARIVTLTHAALREHSAALRHLVGREMRMQWAPLLEFHRDVRVELGGGLSSGLGGATHAESSLLSPRRDKSALGSGKSATRLQLSDLDGESHGDASSESVVGAGGASGPSSPIWRLPPSQV